MGFTQGLMGGYEMAQRNKVLAQEQKQLQLKKQQDNLQMASRFAKTVMDAEEEERPEVYRATMNVAKKYGIDVSELPEFYTSDTDQHLSRVMDVASMTGEKERKLAKDITGRQRDIATGELAFPKVTATGTPEAQEKIFKKTMDLRKEHTKASQKFVIRRDAYNTVLASAEDPSPAGDLSLIFSYMKLVEPNSTVREGEFATAENSASVPERIRVSYNKVVDGTRLSAPMRADFVGRSKKLYVAQLKSQKRLDKQYKGLAKKSDLDEKQVVLDLYGKEQEQIQQTKERILNKPTPEERETAKRLLLQKRGGR